MSQAEVKIVFRRLACKIKKMNWTIIGIGWNKKYVPRNIEYHVYGVFLQQLILLIVGFLTFFFEVTNFSVSKRRRKITKNFSVSKKNHITKNQRMPWQDRTMVSLTLMLVIATISASIQQVEESEEQSLFEQRSKSVWTKNNVHLSEPASHPLLQDDRYLALLLDELDGWVKPQTVNIFTDIVRLYAWSSTPIWNMWSKQWRRTKRGALS